MQNQIYFEKEKKRKKTKNIDGDRKERITDDEYRKQR